MQMKFITSLVLAILTVVFAWQNPQPVTIKLFFMNLNISMSFIILIFVIMGYFIAKGFGVFKEIKYKKTIRAKNKNIVKLKKEITKLNNASFGKELDESIENTENFEDISSILFQNEQIQSYLYENSNSDTKSDEKDEILSKLDDIDVSNLNEVEKTKSVEKIKPITENKIKLDTMFSSFDDLDEDEMFSMAQDSKSNSSKKIPWYMGNSVSKINIKKDDDIEIKKEKYNHTNIDLKAGYNEYIGKNSKKQRKTFKIKNVSDYKGKKLNKSNMKKSQPKKINSEKASLKNIPGYNSLSFDKFDSKKKTKKINSSKDYGSEKSEFFRNELFYIQTDNFSFLKTHTQKTSAENTLSKSSVKERFNWKYNIDKDYTVRESSPHISINQRYENKKMSNIQSKLNSIFSNNKSRKKSMNKL